MLWAVAHTLCFWMPGHCKLSRRSPHDIVVVVRNKWNKKLIVPTAAFPNHLFKNSLSATPIVKLHCYMLLYSVHFV